MSKRNFDEIEDDEIDVSDVLREKKSKKKPCNEQEKAFSFDEVLEYKDDNEKFLKTVQIGSAEGIGLTNNSLVIFRFIKKEGKIEISNYQFNLKIGVISNLIQALEKFQKIIKNKK
jgi:hypothetical protein